MWAVGPVAFAEARCQIEPTAAALQRLEVWGKEGAGATGAIVAHSSRHLAGVTDRSGTVWEALMSGRAESSTAQILDPARRKSKKNRYCQFRRPSNRMIHV
jgi:hypothetical protein